MFHLYLFALLFISELITVIVLEVFVEFGICLVLMYSFLSSL